MNNCQIVIRRKDHHTVAFTFDDYRIAQAVINILDNVAEPNIENDFGYQLIQKKSMRNKLWKDLQSEK